MSCKFSSFLLLAAAIALLPLADSYAQDKQPAPAKAKPAATDQDAPEKEEKSDEPTSIDELALSQSRLADKYARLEELIFKMAEFEAPTNPRRASLLKQAYKQSKDRLTKSQLNSISQRWGALCTAAD